MKRSLASAIRSGAQGVKIRCGGRLGGARDEPVGDLFRGPRAAAHDPRRHRLRLRRGEDDFGRIGVKVWINKGEIMPEGYEGHAAATGHAARRPGPGAPRDAARRDARASAPRASGRPPWPAAATARASARAPAAAVAAAAAAAVAAAARRAAAGRAGGGSDTVERPRTERTRRQVGRGPRAAADRAARSRRRRPPVADAPDTTAADAEPRAEGSDEARRRRRRGGDADAAAEEDQVPQVPARPPARHVEGPDRRCSSATTG